MASVIEARVISSTGNEVYRLIGNTKRGSILSSKFIWEKIGGLRNFELTIARNTEFPLFSGMRIDFYFRDDVFLTNTKIFSGYSEITPSRETNNNTIVISGKGYYWKLEQRLLNESYTSQTISQIINDLDLTGLDITLSTDNFTPPSGTYTIDFKDKTYIQVLDTLLSIANSAYSTDQYIWCVDENKELCFYKLPSTNVSQKFFEGYDFQNPQVSFDNKIINKILLYRPTLADPKETELINTYNNIVSQGEYGIYDKKIIVGDYIDNTAASNFASAILEEFAKPKKLIRIDNFFRKDSKILSDQLYYNDGLDNDAIAIDVGDGLDEFYVRLPELNEERFKRIWDSDYYGISTKPQDKLSVVNECEDVDIWTTSVSNSTIIDTDENVLTGRRVLKWTRDASQPSGDYIEYTLDNIIGNLIDVRFAVYFETAVPNMTFRFYDIDNNYVDINISDYETHLLNTWLRYKEETIFNDISGNLKVLHDSDNYSLSIEHDSVVSGLYIQANELSIRNLSKVRIMLGTGTAEANVIYIDRIEARNSSWEYSRLTLDKAEYTIEKDFVIANMEFGNKSISVLDELKDQTKQGDLAFDMYAKS